MTSSLFWICRCQFSSLSCANLVSGDEFMSFSNCCSWVPIIGFSDVWANCISSNFHACCSFIVSAKSSSSIVVLGCCAVLVRSRCLSTLFSSFLIRSAAPSSSGADLCFLGSYMVTKVWLSFCLGSGSSSSYSSVRCWINALPLGLRYLLRVKVLACVIRSLGSIVTLAARNGGPLTNFFGQLISGLNSRNQGYPRIIRSCPRSTIRNFSIHALSP